MNGPKLWSTSVILDVQSPKSKVTVHNCNFEQSKITFHNHTFVRTKITAHKHNFGLPKWTLVQIYGYMWFISKITQKNPAYGRHQLSRPMRIVEPIQI